MGRIDLLLVFAVSLACGSVVLMGGEGAVRVGAGLVFSLWLPGYALLRALGKDPEGSWSARLLWPMPVSVAILVSAGLLANGLDGGLSATAVVVETEVALVACLLVAGFRHGRLGMGSPKVVLLAVALIAVLAAGWTFLSSMWSEEAGSYVSLYAHPTAEGSLGSPIVTGVGATVDITVGGEFRGPAPEQFRLLPPSGVPVLLVLTPGMRWDVPYHFSFDEAGDYLLTWTLTSAEEPALSRQVRVTLAVE